MCVCVCVCVCGCVGGCAHGVCVCTWHVCTVAVDIFHAVTDLI